MRRHTLAFALVLASSVIACDDDVEIGGRYDLVSVEGEPLPYTVHSDVIDLTILAGFIEIRGADGLLGLDARHVMDADTFRNHAVVEVEVKRDGSRIVLRTEESPIGCTVSPVLRIEDDGDRLRVVDSEPEGDCYTEAPTTPLEMVYQR